MIDNPMVERVARAICDADPLAPDPDAPIYIGTKPAKAWEARAQMAQAAIRAMKDPPDAALDAMNPSGRYASTVIPEAWNDAIDAMLSPPSGT
jgi:hypothetical protein